MKDNLQKLNILINDKVETFDLEPANSLAYKNIKWGRFDELFTPAYWKAQFLMGDIYPQFSVYKLGNTVEEEVVACLLGGHGIPADVGIKAYEAIIESGLLKDKRIDDQKLYDDIFKILSTPLVINDKSIRYRFPKQKSAYLYDALNKIWSQDIPLDDIAFRQWLLSIKGIGLKTASWITRNWLKSDRVAIIDIHIFRAGILMGLFCGSENISSQYLSLEKELLGIADAMQVSMSKLDSIIWHHMRILNYHAIKLIADKVA